MALLDDADMVLTVAGMPEDLQAELAAAPAPMPTMVAYRAGARAAGREGSALAAAHDGMTDISPDDLRQLTDTRIRATLAAVGGNVSEAARRLGISRNTLYRQARY